jgi:hypothetical protein
MQLKLILLGILLLIQCIVFGQQKKKVTVLHRANVNSSNIRKVLIIDTSCKSTFTNCGLHFKKNNTTLQLELTKKKMDDSIKVSAITLQGFVKKETLILKK